MSQPKPNEDVELIPGDPAIPDAQPEPRQPSPDDDPAEEDGENDDDAVDDGK